MHRTVSKVVGVRESLTSTSAAPSILPAFNPRESVSYHNSCVIASIVGVEGKSDVDPLVGGCGTKCGMAFARICSPLSSARTTTKPHMDDNF